MSFQIFISALVLGLLSSFHCVSMCGAIAFSLPTQHLSPTKKLFGILLYNSGRIFTYALLGMLVGIAGRQLYIGGFQQWFSIIAGAGILIIVIQSFLGLPVFHLPGFKKVNGLVQKLIIRFIKKPSFPGIFSLGIANGLLPCGLVYLAITGAMAVGSITGAATFMVAFGMGTFPALFLLSYFGFLISITTRNTIKKSVPFVVALMGILLIVRGMGLNIPYLSPAITNTAATAVRCH
ncbi:sulfite exporter TauE/SafE family protein [Segetibacter koreensis]|uniref:sulfite exporter TauE/SafE family protein n=1 Tax=Segetibacter koreensis TaxID=398037 RepID=UPI00036E1858|nr:sulfite exporter TauE/SafE family protein [Segetibacter koreensis]